MVSEECVGYDPGVRGSISGNRNKLTKPRRHIWLSTVCTGGVCSDPFKPSSHSTSWFPFYVQIFRVSSLWALEVQKKLKELPDSTLNNIWVLTLITIFAIGNFLPAYSSWHRVSWDHFSLEIFFISFVISITTSNSEHLVRLPHVSGLLYLILFVLRR